MNGENGDEGEEGHLRDAAGEVHRPYKEEADRGFECGNKPIKDTLWVSAPSTLGLCVFLYIFAVYACKLTYYIPNQS